MWGRITLAEIEEAKARLNRKRAEALSRQAAEIRSLDAQLQDIESFERVVIAFFEEYMDEAAPLAPPGPVREQASPAFLPEQSTLSPQDKNTPSLVLQIRQNILPRFDHRRSRGSSLAISMAIPSDSRS